MNPLSPENLRVVNRNPFPGIFRGRSERATNTTFREANLLVALRAESASFKIWYADYA